MKPEELARIIAEAEVGHLLVGGDCPEPLDRCFVANIAEVVIRDVCKMVNAHMQHNNPYDSLLVLDIKEHYGII